MQKIPEYIKNKIYQHSKYAKKTESLRVEIEDWFVKQGMKTYGEIDGGFDEDMPITDTLIDNETHHDTEGTIEHLEKILNEET